MATSSELLMAVTAFPHTESRESSPSPHRDDPVSRAFWEQQYQQQQQQHQLHPHLHHSLVLQQHNSLAPPHSSSSSPRHHSPPQFHEVSPKLLAQPASPPEGTSENDSSHLNMKRFVMDNTCEEASPSSASSAVRKARKGRRRSTGKQVIEALQELDETVASVGSVSQREDDVVSQSSQSLGTLQLQHDTISHKQQHERAIITNLAELGDGSSWYGSVGQSIGNVHTVSEQSYPSTKRSGRSSRRKARRKRGASLERIISRTIILSNSQSQSPVRRHSERSGRPSSVSTNDILSDLVQMKRIIELEGPGRSVVTQSTMDHDVRLESPRPGPATPSNNNLLPPMETSEDNSHILLPPFLRQQQSQESPELPKRSEVGSPIFFKFRNGVDEATPPTKPQRAPEDSFFEPSPRQPPSPTWDNKMAQSTPPPRRSAQEPSDVEWNHHPDEPPSLSWDKSNKSGQSRWPRHSLEFSASGTHQSSEDPFKTLDENEAMTSSLIWTLSAESNEKPKVDFYGTRVTDDGFPITVEEQPPQPPAVKPTMMDMFGTSEWTTFDASPFGGFGVKNPFASTGSMPVSPSSITDFQQVTTF